MENYTAVFKINKRDSFNEYNKNDTPYGGELTFNINEIQFAKITIIFEFFPKKTIDNFIEILKNDKGIYENEQYFDNGGILFILNSKILKITTSHFGISTELSLIPNLSLLQSFNKMKRYLK